MMKYILFLKRPEGTYKVSAFESDAEYLSDQKAEAATQLSLYLLRHYPVTFTDNESGGAAGCPPLKGRALKDKRNGKIVWRPGALQCTLQEGLFYAEAQQEQPAETCWWKYALPASKRTSIEMDIQNAWKKGFEEGYAKGRTLN